jgi:hypothetical protein
VLERRGRCTYGRSVGAEMVVKEGRVTIGEQEDATSGKMLARAGQAGSDAPVPARGPRATVQTAAAWPSPQALARSDIGEPKLLRPAPGTGERAGRYTARAIRRRAGGKQNIRGSHAIKSEDKHQS